MPDKYANFAELSRDEPTDAYAVRYQDRGSTTIVVAPHGGGIEPGTSEICVGIADPDLSWYLFEGQKETGNEDLHITSSSFDEPDCLRLMSGARRVLTIHGERSDLDVAFVGGLHKPTVRSLLENLEAYGIEARKHHDPKLQGISYQNICNRGLMGEGVQLELAKGLRRTLFEGLSRTGRQSVTVRFQRFCEAVRKALDDVPV